MKPKSWWSKAVQIVRYMLGFRNRIYLWKLGSIEHRVWPNERAIHELSDSLAKWDGKSDFHLVWNDGVDVQLVAVDANDLQVIAPADINVEVKEGQLIITKKGD